MDFSGLLDHPAVQSSALPVIASFVLAGLIRLIGGPGRGGLLAGAAVACALLVTLWTVFGFPLLPPRSAGEKVFVLTAAALVLGFGLDLTHPGRWAARVLLVAGAAGGLWWIGLNRLGIPALDADWLHFAVLLAGVSAVLVRLEACGDGAPDPTVMPLVAALGAGGVAMASGSASVAQTLFALAAATGGYLLWNWPKRRFPFGRSALFGAGLPLAFLVGQAAFYTKSPPAALALLLPIFFADILAVRLVKGGGPVANAMRTVALGLIALIPAAAAIGVAVWLSGGGDDPYR